MATKKALKKVKSDGMLSEPYKSDDRNRITLNEGQIPASFVGKLKGKYTLEVDVELVESGIGSYGERMGKKYHTFAINKTKLKD